jgi:hypothetical protein
MNTALFLPTKYGYALVQSRYLSRIFTDKESVLKAANFGPADKALWQVDELDPAKNCVIELNLDISGDETSSGSWLLILLTADEVVKRFSA